MRGAVGTVAILLLAGCEGLGAGDLVRARTLVFSSAGTPMYAGQALAFMSCGGGAFCHSSAARGVARHGAPAEGNFDLEPSCDDLDPMRSSVRRLREGQRRLFEYRHAAWQLVTAEAMPPRSAQFDALFLTNARNESGRYAWQFPEDPSLGTPARPLPTLATAEGREIFRNWLAAGLPVVEATMGPTETDPPGADCMDGQVGDCIVAESPCVPAPTWESIYRVVISPQCGRSCHAGPPNEYLDWHRLDLSTEEEAYRALVGVAAMGLDTEEGDGCADSGLMRVAPGDPEASLLLRKLAGSRDWNEDGAPDLDCGEPMPAAALALPDAILDVVAQWIEGGARRE
ncbi:MAG: hypothetical protein NZ898_08615 [Myxococcota bacterium]|nr:hypothetical protein [Myxococcota bacterium]MDW8363096.1 hypothetical protein [Myxococcales bacterium]